MDGQQKQIGSLWSEKYAAAPRPGEGRRWTDSPAVIRYLTQLVCGEPLDSMREGLIRLLRNISPALPYKRGISVACGLGNKEMSLLENNIVSHFTCYELSEEAVAAGTREAEKRGLGDRIRFHHADAFARDLTPGGFDFVYWDNAMHHMLDARAAMRWSKHLLARGGCFFMYDYVGPSRFQWTDEQFRMVRQVLESLDDAYFLIPGTEYMWKKEPSKMSVEEMIAADPSEAADSDAILPAFRENFPSGTIIPLGGLIYVLGLDGILVNIPENSVLLHKLLAIDASLSRHGHNYYAVAYHINMT